MSVSVRVSGPLPPTPLQVRAVSTRRVQAGVREGLSVVRRHARDLAAPHRRSGAYERSFVIDVVKRSGSVVIGQLTNTSDHAAALEDGRRGFSARDEYVMVPTKHGLARRKRALNLQGAGGIFRAKVGPAKGYHIVERAMALSEAEIQAAAELQADRIAADIQASMR